MTSFAQTLRLFQSGSITREALFDEIDKRLASERVDETWLLTMLEREQRNVSLPQDVFDAVKQQIVEAAEKKMDKMTKRAGMDENWPQDAEEDLNRTQLATSFLQPKEPQDIDYAVSGEKDSALSRNGEEFPDLPIKGVGDTLNDRFILEEQVGSGGMSTIYRALDKRKLEANDRDPYVAVKILNVEFRAHPHSFIALQREAKKCQRLAHPNIVRAYDFDRDGSTVYMTMEYLSGHSLAHKLKNPNFKGMSCEEAMPIVEGMAEALSFAHKNGIVHADFKPANVILTEDGQIKVIDFGIARVFQVPGEGDIEATKFDPGSLGALTPTYASPEMLEHGEPDPRDDVYALACITYEMLTGRHPFGRRQAVEARDGGLSLDKKKTLSRKQWKALRAALEFDRDKRTSSATRFLDDIRPNCIKKPRLALVASILFAGLVAGFMALKNIDLLDYSLPVVSEYGVDSNHQTEKFSTDPGPDPALTSAVVVTAVEHPDEPAANPLQTRATETGADLASFAVDEPDKNSIEQSSIPTLTIEPIMAALDAYACSALTATLDEGVVSVSGYMSESVTNEALDAKLSSIPGVTRIRTDITPVSNVMCEVVDLYRPYWLLNQHKTLGTSLTPEKQLNEFVAGESLVVKVKTPPYRSYINVDYYSLDGHVVHMLPSSRAQANQAPANYTAVLGDLDQWVISEPYGAELVVLLTTPESLFSTLRKEYETASDYLVALRDQLSRIDDSSDTGITADFLIINTRDKL